MIEKLVIWETYLFFSIAEMVFYMCLDKPKFCPAWEAPLLKPAVKKEKTTLVLNFK